MKRKALAVAAAVTLAAGWVGAGSPAGAEEVTVTLSTSGTWTVPEGVTSVTLVTVGASGGSCNVDLGGVGGLGAAVTTELTVTPGDVLEIAIGGAGACAPTVPDATTFATGGTNGGGSGANDRGGWIGASGGGATWVRLGGSPLSVAGGGGGAGGFPQSEQLGVAPGGAGGTPIGGDGQAPFPFDPPAATGGTQTEGGAAGGWDDMVQYRGTAGTSGQGGNSSTTSGGGGGGGWFGGGGGGGGTSTGSGGGGSSWVDLDVVDSVEYGLAADHGNGYVLVSYDDPTPPTTPTTAGPGSTTTTTAPGGSTSTTTAPGTGTGTAPGASGRGSEVVPAFTG